MNKISFLIYRMDVVGGTERVILNLADGFITQMNSEVSIVALTGKGCFLTMPPGVIFHTLYDIPFYKKSFVLRKYLRDNEIDLLISVGVTRLNIWLALSLPLFHNIKVVATEHMNVMNSSCFVRLLKKKLFGNFDRFVLLTQANEEYYKKCGLKNVITIPNSNSFAVINNIEYLSRPKVLLAIGRLEEQKNFLHLLFAWKNIFRNYPDWVLHIVGEGKMEDEMKRYIDNNDMNYSCVILPFVKDVSQYYSSAQIFVMSSLFEGLPMVLLEAQQYGIPCVSYDCETGPRDIILNGENGFLAENQNYEDLADKLSTLLSNETLRLEFHRKSLFYSQRFSKDVVLEKWSNLFDDIFVK